jgi:hypothetical protein
MTNSDRRLAIGFMLIAMAFSAIAGESEYQSVWEDKAGRLHIKVSSGKEEIVRKVKDQTSFGDPMIAPDRRTVGWLINYPPDGNNSYELPETLVLYRAAHVLHRFNTDQICWDWKFRNGGKRVAYCTGPTHGGAAQCLLREVDSGKIVARWTPKPSGSPPAWAKDLHY